MTNCKNCGAPLSGCVCEYCGTYYPELQTVIVAACDSVEVEDPGVFRVKQGDIHQIQPSAAASELDTIEDAFRRLAVASSFTCSEFADASSRMMHPVNVDLDGPIGNRTRKRLVTGLRRAKWQG